MSGLVERRGPTIGEFAADAMERAREAGREEGRKEAAARIEALEGALRTIIAEDGPGYPHGTCADTARAALNGGSDG